MAEVRVRVAAYVVRAAPSGLELLVFDHVGAPQAGRQVPAGGVRAGEPLEAAVRREVAEETGVTDVTVRMSLGVSQRPHPRTGAPRVTAFYYATTGDPRSGWQHAVTGGGKDSGLRFGCWFLPLPQVAGSLADRQDEFIPDLLREAGRMAAPLSVPRLPAGPFVLRPFTLDDVDVVREASADPYIPLITTVPAVFTAGEGRRFIERQWGRAERGTGYSFAIADAGTGKAVGQAGLWLKDAAEGRASVGYWVAESGRGRGAAGRAVLALARWAHDELRIPRLELHVEPWNVASIKAAELAGFRREGLLRGWQEMGSQRRDLLLYARLAGDPLPSP
jgi:RimJ/RimL family protein N-acetyltransferase/8-oxo-dGTP pyrophosphatase MutT (NUDIX family)